MTEDQRLRLRAVGEKLAALERDMARLQATLELRRMLRDVEKGD